MKCRCPHEAARDSVRLGGRVFARVRAVREAVGQNVEVAVDCHSRFDVKEALTVARALEELDLFWFEEPVGVQDMAGLAAIRSRIQQPLATAESLFGAEAFHRVMAAEAADVVMPDIKHAGGLQETLAIGEMATACHVGFAPHNPSGPLATVASGHVARVCSRIPDIGVCLGGSCLAC